MLRLRCPQWEESAGKTGVLLSVGQGLRGGGGGWNLGTGGGIGPGLGGAHPCMPQEGQHKYTEHVGGDGRKVRVCCPDSLYFLCK